MKVAISLIVLFVSVNVYSQSIPDRIDYQKYWIDYSKKHEESEAARRSADQAKEELSLKERDLNNLKQDAERLRNSITQNEKDIRDNEENIRKLELNIQNLTQRIDEETRKLEELNTTLQLDLTKQNSIERSVREQEAKVNQLDEQRAVAQRRLDEVLNQIEENKLKVKSNEDEIARIEKILRDFELQARELARKYRLNPDDKLLGELLKKLKDEEKNLERMSREEQSLQNEVEKLRDEVSILEGVISQKQESVNMLASEVSRLSDEIQALKSQQKQLQDELRRSKSDLTKSEQGLADKRIQHHNAKTTADNYDVNVRQPAWAATKASHDQVVILNEEVKRLVVELENASTPEDKEKIKAQLDDAKQRLQVRLDETQRLRTISQNADEEQKRLNLKTQGLGQEVDKLTVAIQNIEQNIVDYEQSINRIEADLTRIEVQLTSFKSQLRTEQDSLVQAQSNYNLKNRSLSSEELKYQRISADLATQTNYVEQIREDHKKFDEASYENKFLALEKKDHENENAKIKPIITKLEKESEPLRKDLKRIEDRLIVENQTLDRLGEERIAIDQEINRLQNQMQSSQSLLTSLELQQQNDQNTLGTTKNRVNQLKSDLLSHKNKLSQLEGANGLIAKAKTARDQSQARYDTSETKARQLKKIEEDAYAKFQTIKRQFDQEMTAVVERAHKESRSLGEKEALDRVAVDAPKNAKIDGELVGRSLGEAKARRSQFRASFDLARVGGQQDGQKQGHEKGHVQAFAKATGYEEGYQLENNEQNKEVGFVKGKESGVQRANVAARPYESKAAEAERVSQWMRELDSIELDNILSGVPLSALQSRATSAGIKYELTSLRAHSTQSKESVSLNLNSNLANQKSRNIQEDPYDDKNIPGVPELRLDRLKLNGEPIPSSVPSVSYSYPAPTTNFDHPEFQTAYNNQFKQKYAESYRGAYLSESIGYPAKYRAVFSDEQVRAHELAVNKEYPEVSIAGDKNGYTYGYKERFTTAFNMAFNSFIKKYQDSISQGQPIDVEEEVDQELLIAHEQQFNLGKSEGLILGKKAGYQFAYQAGFLAGDKQGYDDHIDDAIAQAELRGRESVQKEFATSVKIKANGADLQEDGQLAQGQAVQLNLDISNYGGVASSGGQLIAKIEPVSGFYGESLTAQIRSLPANSKAKVLKVASGHAVSGFKIIENGAYLNDFQKLHLVVKLYENSVSNKPIGSFEIKRNVSSSLNAYAVSKPDTSKLGLMTWKTGADSWPVVTDPTNPNLKHNKVCLANYNLEEKSFEYEVLSLDNRLQVRPGWSSVSKLAGKKENTKDWFRCFDFVVRSTVDKKQQPDVFKTIFQVKLREPQTKKLIFDGKLLVDAQIIY